MGCVSIESEKEEKPKKVSQPTTVQIYVAQGICNKVIMMGGCFKCKTRREREREKMTK